MKYPLPPTPLLTFFKGTRDGAFANEVNDRWHHLTYFKIIEPLAFYEKIEGIREISVEGIYAYLLGLPNATVPMIMRCLEIALKNKYKEVEKKDPPENLKELIEWGEKLYGGEEKQYLHSFRHVRNLIHCEKIVDEQLALICIKEVTNIINILFPFPTAFVKIYCEYCKEDHKYDFNREKFYFGNTFNLICSKSGREYPYTIIP